MHFDVVSSVFKIEPSVFLTEYFPTFSWQKTPLLPGVYVSKNDLLFSLICVIKFCYRVESRHRPIVIAFHWWAFFLLGMKTNWHYSVFHFPVFYILEHKMLHYSNTRLSHSLNISAILSSTPGAFLFFRPLEKIFHRILINKEQ